MIIYWSMILWVVVVYGVYILNHRNTIVLAPNDSKLEVYRKIPISYAIATFAYIIYWVGVRTWIFDTGVYIQLFRDIPVNFSEAFYAIDWNGKSPGWDLFNVVFKCFISQNYTWWLMTIAIITGLCIMIPLRKYSCDFFFSAFVFVSLGTFTWMMNGTRQFVCVAVAFAASSLIKDGKIYKFILLILLLSTVHSTVLMMIPIYFIAKCKPWSFRIFIFILAIVLLATFAEPFFKGLDDNVLSNTAYAGATEQFEEDDGVNPIRVAFALIFPVLALLKRKDLEIYYDSDPMLMISVNMSLVSAALYFVGVFTSGILIGRLPIYCSVYNMLLIPYLINYGFNKHDKFIVRLAMIGLLLFDFILECPQFYVSNITGYIGKL